MVDKTAPTEALPPNSEELSLFLGAQGSRITHIVDAYARQAIAADRAIRAGDAAPDGVWVPREPTEAMIEAAKDERMECFRDTSISVGAALARILRVALAAAPQPTRVDKRVETLPDEIRRIIESLHTQDNRITDNPLFAVQQKRRFGGVDSEYADASVWIADGCEVGAEEAERLDALVESGESVPADCQHMGYIDRWEFVTGCFTEQGCKDYIARNGHNLCKPRIYAYGSYRNAEFIALRKWLMSLSAPLVAGGEQP